MNLSRYIKQFWFQNIGVVLVEVFKSVTDTVANILMANALTALTKLQAHEFLVWSAWAVLAYLGGAVGIYLEIYYVTHVIYLMDTALRRDIGQKLAAVNYEDYHRQSDSVYVSWLTNDITQINTYGFYNLVDIFSAISDIVFALIGLLYYRYSLVLLTVVLAIVMLVVPKLFGQPVQKRSQALSAANEQSMNQFSDILAGFDDLLMLNLRQRIVEKIAASSTRIMHATDRHKRLVGAMVGSSAAIGNLSQVAVMGFTGYLAFQRLVPIGAIMATRNFAESIFTGVANAGTLGIVTQGLDPLFAKYNALTPDPAKGQAMVGPLRQALQMNQISFTYPDAQQPTLADFNLTLGAGEKYALVGPSGQGKTTIINLLAGNLTQYEGTLRFDGQDYRTIAPQAIRDQIVVLNQIPFIFNDTLRQNITLGREFTDQQLQTALTESGLADVVAKLPQGLDTLLTKSGRNLSGGQRQRVVLARGLIGGRKIVFMDEGTASLDEAAAAQIEDSLLARADVTLLMVTHHLRNEIRPQFDRVITLGEEQD